MIIVELSIDLVEIARNLDLTEAEAVIISACVQMPSLEAIPQVEEETGLPVLSAATATLRSILESLNLSLDIPGGGQLLQMNHSQFRIGVEGLLLLILGTEFLFNICVCY